MSRVLQTVDGGDAHAVFLALRAAFAGGPAVLPAEPPRGDAPPSLPEPPRTVPQRVVLVVQTSGSTGRPKRVALSADALLAGAAASEAMLGGPGQWLLALPAHYIAGINVLVRSLASQTVPVILPPGHFDPLAFTRAAGTMDADLRFVSLVPAQLARLLAVDEALGALRRFDRILVGGQSTPASLLERSAELGLRVTRSYGSSETSGGCFYDGVPIGNARARVVDGEVEIAGSMLAEGYLDDAERTAAAFHEDDGVRWYRTGDTGVLVDGVLQVTGRLDDVIVSGGVNVSLAAVERVVRACPGLQDAVVVAGPSARWGEVPVVVTEAADSRLTELRAIVRTALGGAAAPDAIVVLEQLPRLASGKPDRVALAALVAARGQESSR
jgi:O-succinylbenzoic acid--CoA ligase